MPNANQVVASFRDYAGAQRAVDALSDRGFPVAGLAIVGANLQSFEQITGRRRYGRATFEGAVNGAIVGVLIGWLLGLFTLVAPLASLLAIALWGLVIGGVIGAIAGVAGHAMTGGRRDFSSVSTVRAERYDIQALASIAGDARHTIAEIAPEAVSQPSGS